MIKSVNMLNTLPILKLYFITFIQHMRDGHLWNITENSPVYTSYNNKILRQEQQS